MKVFIDAMGATSASGGMRLYAEEIVGSWAESYPSDRLTVLGGTWAEQRFAEYPNVTVLTWKNESTLMRAIGQFLVSAVGFVATHSEVLLSISPIVSPLVPRRLTICVVHDWRHLKNQSEFGFFQKQYRRLWVLSVKQAGEVVSISEKTGDETRRIAAGSQPRVIENGRDNARRWSTTDELLTSDHAPYLVTFGHQSNKRPDLVIRGFAETRWEMNAQIRLTVLGAAGDYAKALAELADSLGVGGSCDFPGFVSDIEYQSIVQRSSVVVLASSDEGFGLPVAEAQYFGVPVVVASDSGLDAIHEGLIVARPTVDGMATAFAVALSLGRGKPKRIPMGTWERAVGKLRDLSLQLISPGRP